MRHKDTRKIKREHRKMCYIIVQTVNKDGTVKKERKRINQTPLKVYARCLDGMSKEWFKRKVS